MKKIKTSLWILVTLVVGFLSFYATDVSAAAALKGWAWSDNVGWVSFSQKNDNSPYGYGVTVLDDMKLSGFAWSDNVGWIKFDPSFTGEAGGGDNFGAKLVGNVIKGWARVCTGTVNKDCTGASRNDGWNGWVKMSSSVLPWTTDGFSFVGNSISGYAWGSEVVGWLKSVDISRAQNLPPAAPTISDASNHYYVNTPYIFYLKASDPDSNYVFYQVDTNADGAGDLAVPDKGYMSSGALTPYTASFTARGPVKLAARTADVAYTSGIPPVSSVVNPINGPANSDSALSGWTFKDITIENRPPTDPVITFESANTYKAGDSLGLRLVSTDPENDKIEYTITWGDGTGSETSSIYASGIKTAVLSHTYASTGTYTITARARDDYMADRRTSGITTVQVSIAQVDSSVGCKPSATCGGSQIYVSCLASNTKPIAYSNVSWSVTIPTDFGGVLPLAFAWSGGPDSKMVPTTYSGTSATIGAYFTTEGLHDGPKLNVTDARGRVAQLTTPGNAPNCQNVDVQKRPLDASVLAGKKASSANSQSVSVGVGESAGISLMATGGMGTVSCSPEEQLAVDANAHNVSSNFVFTPKVFAKDEQFQKSFTTQVFKKVGDFPYTMKCKDNYGTKSFTATVHVVAKPSFNEF